MSSETVKVPETPGFVQVLLSIVPTNIVGAFAEPNLLGIIFTARVFGIALLKLRESEKKHDVAEDSTEVAEQQVY
ncbi:cation:dicarboxylate symporter family transporter [Marinobacter fuscus]|uniref:cation:dicarboxylate symporter family transporter n=1 Tax=Marinobacter fuscus TaxID=2109942 RepID=UPI001F0CCC7D|nr:cation:dicarboxylase symporter family transporter [Marinobacter fuscus]